MFWLAVVLGDPAGEMATGVVLRKRITRRTVHGSAADMLYSSRRYDGIIDELPAVDGHPTQCESVRHGIGLPHGL